MISIRSVIGPAAILVAGLMLGACTDSNAAVLGPGTSAPRPELQSNPDLQSNPELQSNVDNLPATGALAPARHTGPQGVVGQFVTDCALSHSAPDDPIVFPSNPSKPGSGTAAEHSAHLGSAHPSPADGGTDANAASGAAGHSVGHSHMHNFFGNTTTDSASTLASLLKGGTTCKKQLDTAAYWAPELRDHGQAVTPTKSTAYYRAGKGVDPKLVKAYPPGLMIIAGNADATAEAPQSPDLAGWSCGTSSIQFAVPPDCPASAPLRGVITFPDCWDGINTDTADHRSHMANSSGGLCPASHPVHVPQLTFAITYPISGSGHDLSLASGGINGLHSDFINAWHQKALVQEIELCLHREVVCALSSNRGEESLFTG
ncbi:MAG: DUF1996 domain-containing protein [Microthrixaceae bacterium]